MIRSGERVMFCEWELLTSDELFELRQEMQSVLRERLIARRQMLDDQLRKLNQRADGHSPDSRT